MDRLRNSNIRKELNVDSMINKIQVTDDTRMNIWPDQMILNYLSKEEYTTTSRL